MRAHPPAEEHLCPHAQHLRGPRQRRHPGAAETFRRACPLARPLPTARRPDRESAPPTRPLCPHALQVVLRLFAVWLATSAEHGCVGCPTIMLYKSALRTLLPALHTLPAADLRMLVACQHAVTGPFGNSVVYQSLLPHICKAAVLG